VWVVISEAIKRAVRDALIAFMVARTTHKPRIRKQHQHADREAHGAGTITAGPPIPNAPSLLFRFCRACICVAARKPLFGDSRVRGESSLA
jgi:hypothetical protein